MRVCISLSIWEGCDTSPLKNYPFFLANIHNSLDPWTVSEGQLKEPAWSFYFANLEEILHRAHRRGNLIYTAWFLKFRGKYFFSTKVPKISVITLYLSLFCIYNGINKKIKHIFQISFFSKLLISKVSFE